MTKEETLQLKGIAILMMLFLHLFNTTANVEQCQTYIYFWNGKPLVLALSRVAAFCVPIYIFLSGYGLAITYKQNQRIMRSWNRDHLAICQRNTKPEQFCSDFSCIAQRTRCISKQSVTSDGSRAMVKNTIPKPPIHWVSDRQKSSPWGH